jgi:hypothetical protein
MELKLYQIAIAVIALFMIYQGGKDYLKGGNNQTFTKFFVRVLVWGGMTAIVIFPHLTNFAARIIGIQDNVNAAILAGFILVFLMIFKLLSAIERLEQQITSLTRKDALTAIQKDKETEL